MVTYTDLYPDSVKLLSRKHFVDEGALTFTVPTNPLYKFMIAHTIACGGMGDGYGGSGVLTKTKAAITPGELLSIQVGRVSTASVLGDSFVRRANNTIICYSDRGRGNGNPGLAINSTGDIKLNGNPGNSGTAQMLGAPPTDRDSPKSQGFGGFGFYYGQLLGQAADYGGGGKLIPLYDSDGNFTGSYLSNGAGSGKVLLEFFNGDPGAIQ